MRSSSSCCWFPYCCTGVADVQNHSQACPQTLVVLRQLIGMKMWPYLPRQPTCKGSKVSRLALAAGTAVLSELVLPYELLLG